jgi:hypothetical protein
MKTWKSNDYFLKIPPFEKQSPAPNPSLLRFELMAFYLLGRSSTTEPYPQPEKQRF